MGTLGNSGSLFSLCPPPSPPNPFSLAYVTKTAYTDRLHWTRFCHTFDHTSHRLEGSRPRIFRSYLLSRVIRRAISLLGEKIRRFVALVWFTLIRTLQPWSLTVTRYDLFHSANSLEAWETLPDRAVGLSISIISIYHTSEKYFSRALIG